MKVTNENTTKYVWWHSDEQSKLIISHKTVNFGFQVLLNDSLLCVSVCVCVCVNVCVCVCRMMSFTQNQPKHLSCD